MFPWDDLTEKIVAGLLGATGAVGSAVLAAEVSGGAFVQIGLAVFGVVSLLIGWLVKLVLEIRDQTAAATGQDALLSAALTRLIDQGTDHETRIRVLERKR